MKKLFLLLLIPSVLQAATTVTARVTGTSRPSYNEYMSLQEAVTTYAKDLVAADEIYEIKISSAFTDTVAVTFETAWNTDSTRYIDIYTYGAGKSTGTPGVGWRLHVAGTDSTHTKSIAINDTLNITFNGLNIGLDTNGYQRRATGIWLADNKNGTYIIKNCVFYKQSASVGTYNDCQGILTQYSNSPTMYIFNNMFLGMRAGGTGTKTTSAICLDNYGGGSYFIYSNTMSSSTGNGIKCDKGTLYLKNNISICNILGDYNFSGTYSLDASSCTNISSDATSPNAAYQLKTVLVKDAPNWDFHLSASDTEAKDKGTTTSSDSSPMNFTTDIDGDTRSGTWDIGADEITSSASGPGISIGGGVRLGN